MNKRRILVPALLAAGRLLHAQTSGPPLSLQEAEAMAVKNHPRVLASQANYLRADQIITETRSAYYPALNGDVTGSQATDNSRIGAGFLSSSRLFNRLGYGITLSQLITDSGRTPNLVATSKLQAEASRQDYQATQHDIITAVEQAYSETLLSQQLVKLAEQTVATRQAVVDQVSELMRNKLKSQLDVSFAEVSLSDAKLMLLRAQARLGSAYANLGQALGIQQSIRFQLTDEPMPPNPPKDPEGLIAQALENRPELKSLRLQREADRKYVRAEADLKLPTVSLTGVAGFLPLIDPENANPAISPEYEGAAVNVQIPIFNGHLFSARRRAAEYQLQAADERVRDLKDRVARDVRTAWESARTAYEAIGATALLLQQANLALDLAQGRYNLGLAAIVELTQAQLAQTQAQVENLNAKYEYQEAYAGLQYTLGSLH
ncbi:MAG: TolC family protein [Bryobacteraceae bacterium]